MLALNSLQCEKLIKKMPKSEKTFRGILVLKSLWYCSFGKFESKYFYGCCLLIYFLKSCLLKTSSGLSDICGFFGGVCVGDARHPLDEPQIVTKT